MERGVEVLLVEILKMAIVVAVVKLVVSLVIGVISIVHVMVLLCVEVMVPDAVEIWDAVDGAALIGVTLLHEAMSAVKQYLTL